MKNRAELPHIKYLAVSEHDLDWGMIVTTVGFQHIPAGSPYPSRHHPSQYWFHPDAGRVLDEFQLVYITEGEGLFCSQHCPQTAVKAGHALLLFPGEWHSYRPGPGGWATYWVGFKGAFAEQLQQHRFFSRESPLHHIGYNERLAGLFGELTAYAGQEKAGYQQVISSIAIHILGLVNYIIQNNLFTDPDIVTKIEKARQMMREHPGGELPPEQLAQALNISYSWFRRMFRRYTGMAPAQYQQQLKMQQAREWLVSSDKSIKEIAYLLNFESPNYFNTFFKQKAGITPARFRKMWHKP